MNESSAEAEEPDYDLSGRVWLLLLMEALAHAGLLPIAKLRLHRILYLSNCLAPVFQSKPPKATVIKYRRGPFYPDAQWDIDRMAAGGLLAITEIGYQPKDEFGPWVESTYDLSRAGYSAARSLLGISSACRVHEFLLELANAFSSFPDERLDPAPLQDVNYAAPAKPEGALIDFESIASNYSLQTAVAFRNLAPLQGATNRREQIYFYMRYLEQRNLAAS